MSEIYCDPYDYELEAHPHPMWARMRNEAPLYDNERYDFFALSRFQDVLDASVESTRAPPHTAPSAGGGSCRSPRGGIHGTTGSRTRHLREGRRHLATGHELAREGEPAGLRDGLGLRQGSRARRVRLRRQGLDH